MCPLSAYRRGWAVSFMVVISRRIEMAYAVESEVVALNDASRMFAEWKMRQSKTRLVAELRTWALAQDHSLSQPPLRFA